jgi:hypothetical protein
MGFSGNTYMFLFLHKTKAVSMNEGILDIETKISTYSELS